MKTTLCGSASETLTPLLISILEQGIILSDVSCLQKFCLIIDNNHPGAFDTWVCTAIRRNVVELSLRSFDDDFIPRLPPIVYTSKTLNLCSGCPVLEELFIVPTDGNFNFSVPTLKRLTIEIHDLDVDLSLEHQLNRFIIDAPNLQDLYINDGNLTGFTLLNLSSLLIANIFVDCTDANPSHLSRYAGRFYQLLNGIANAKHLSLSLYGSKLPGSTMSFITNGSSYVAPTFHRLTSLTVGSCGWGMLNVFIECSPKLEVLDINKRCRIVKSWSPPPRVPACLQSCLKEILIKGFDGEEYELKAIAYLLKNANTLKEMMIYCRGVKKEDHNVCEKLSQFPKASTHCLLHVVI